MKKAQLIALFVLAGLLCSMQPVFANNISVTIGKPANFTAGQHPVGVATFNGKVLGQPAPFDAYIGSNPTGPNFSASWTFGPYTLPTSPTITGATITIGILTSPWDGGTLTISGNPTFFPENMNPVKSFTLDGTDILTSLLNADVVGTPSNTYEVDTITIPSADLSAL